MRHVSIRQLLIMGLGGVLCAMLLLAAGWLWSLEQLHGRKQVIYTNSENLQTALALELAVTTADDHPARWDEAAKLIKRLPDNATSDQERMLVRLRQTQLRQSGSNGALKLERARLLEAVKLHSDLNEEEMRDAMLTGNAMERSIRILAPLTLLAAALLIGWRSYRFWTRIIYPVERLSQTAAAFGRGDHSVRAPVLWDDELGALCRAFNDMAQQISEREEERLDFVAAVAHDLKTPLVVIGGAAHLMQEKALPPDEQRRWLKTIVKNTRTLEGTIADLSNGVQAQTGRLELQRETFDLSVLAGECAHSLQETGVEHDLRCDCETAAPVWGDRARLERVIQNLLSNALKYSPRGSEVRLVVEARDGTILLRVEDEGIGIASADVPRIFEPFQRLKEARAKATGIGMGLASARKIIEAHGGLIRVMSQPQHGTTIEVRLPRAEMEVEK